MRTAEISRTTKETDISVSLCLDGSGKNNIDTGCGFFDHMLELFACHGRFDLEVICKGDARVDFHHSVEDCGIVLGSAFTKALGDKAGITRYGSLMLPMDEVLIAAAVDLSGRASLGWQLNIPAEKCGDFDTELAKEFMTAFVRTLKGSVHLVQMAGENSHHIIEGSFKALARALAQAVAVDERLGGKIMSTKGTIE